MPRPVSVALLGLWHVHADDYARQVNEHDDTVLTAVWDTDEGRGRAGAERLGVDFVGDLDTLLARADIDAVVVTTPTADHPAVLRAAARAGKHIFTEKLLAASVEQVDELIAAARENDIALVVSLPRLSEPVTIAIRGLIADGALGTPTYSRVRMAHDGWINDWLPERFANRDEALGGALTDLGAHPVYLTQAFLGSRPATVNAAYTRLTEREVEDNAVVTVAYPNGAIGVIEASFVTTPGAFTIEVRGTEGSVLYGFGSERLLLKGEHAGGNGWQEVELPTAESGPFAQWVEHIRTGTTAVHNLDAARELTRLVAAANDAAASGRTVDYATTR